MYYCISDFGWVCCTRASCLEYPNFMSPSLPTQATRLISLATLSLPIPPRTAVIEGDYHDALLAQRQEIRITNN